MLWMSSRITVRYGKVFVNVRGTYETFLKFTTMFKMISMIKILCMTIWKIMFWKHHSVTFLAHFFKYFLIFQVKVIMSWVELMAATSIDILRKLQNWYDYVILMWVESRIWQELCKLYILYKIVIRWVVLKSP